MNTTFYYAIAPSELFHLQEQCTIWMPETQPLDQAIWEPSQIIATCDLSYLFQISERLKIGAIAPSDVIWKKSRTKQRQVTSLEVTARLQTSFA